MGQPWASVIAGAPGFLEVAGGELIRVNGVASPGDPLADNLVAGSPVGLLGIELDNRRRNRANGLVEAASAGFFDVRIQQAFGNCPNLIQTRRLRHVPGVQVGAAALRSLDLEAIATVSSADTFFVASYADGRGGVSERAVDISHRGGRPGFIDVRGNCLTIPDYAGNRYFNTLGNILSSGRAGLLFVDVNSGDLLQLTGHAALLKTTPAPSFKGAERLWQVHVDAGVRHRAALCLRAVP